MDFSISVIHKALVHDTRLFKYQLKAVKRRTLEMTCRTTNVFFLQLGDIAIRVTEQMIETSRRFSMKFLRGGT